MSIGGLIMWLVSLEQEEEILIGPHFDKTFKTFSQCADWEFLIKKQELSIFHVWHLREKERSCQCLNYLWPYLCFEIVMVMISAVEDNPVI